MTATHTLYRVQDANGNGPYVLASWPGRDSLLASHDNRTPPAVPAGYLSACTSRRALTAWFGPWLPALVASGFAIVRLTVEEASVTRAGQRVDTEVSYRPAGVLATRVCRGLMLRYAVARPAMPTTSRVAPNYVARMQAELTPQPTGGPRPAYSRAAVLAEVRGRAAYLARVRDTLASHGYAALADA